MSTERRNMEEAADLLHRMQPTDDWKPYWPMVITFDCGCVYTTFGGCVQWMHDHRGETPLDDMPIDWNEEGWLWD